MIKRIREYRNNPLRLIEIVVEGLNRGFISMSFIRMDYEEPLMDIYMKYNEMIITMEVFGVRREDIKVYVTKRMIRVRAGNRFYRNIRLPFKINPDNVKITYNNGILEIKGEKLTK